MELKLWSLWLAGVILQSINRTFMELKQLKVWHKTMADNVLIEPLWNWNICRVNNTMLNAGINRTFMELKQIWAVQV